MIQPNIYCQCDDARTAVLLASQGLGIAIVPFSATSYIQGNENVTFSYLKESFFASKMAIIHKKNQYLSLNAQALIATIKSHF